MDFFAWAFIVALTLPLDEEEKLPRVISCPDDPLGSKTACKAPRFVVVLVFGLLLLLWLLLLCGF